MNRPNILSRTLLLVVAGSIVVAGCSNSSPTASNRTLVVDTSFQLKTADPGRAAELTAELIDHLVYDTLLTYPDGTQLSTPSPALATSYTASTDNKTFTFKLRPNVKFSDGTALTAGDVAFSINRLKNLNGVVSFLAGGVAALAPDPGTVVLASGDPDPAIPSKVATYYFSVLNSKVVKANGGTDAEGADKSDQAEKYLDLHSAGSGPYTISSIDASTQVILTANSNYWGPKPAYSRIVIRNVAAPNQLINIQKGESQIALDLSPSQAASLGSQYQIATAPALDMMYLGFTADPSVSSVASNPKFREAVRYAIDNQKLLQIVGKGAIQATGAVMVGQLGSLPASEAVQQDVNRAKAALAQSGLVNPTVAMDFFTDVTPHGVPYPSVATEIQAELKQVGITVNLLGAPQTVALQKYRNGQSQMVLSDFDPPMPGPYLSFVFLPGSVYGGRLKWKQGADPSLEALGAKAQAASTDSERASLWQQVCRQLNAEGPYVVLFQPGSVVAANASVKTVRANPIYFMDWQLLT